MKGRERFLDFKGMNRTHLRRKRTGFCNTCGGIIVHWPNSCLGGFVVPYLGFALLSNLRVAASRQR